jgi:hypothetical protein
VLSLQHSIRQSRKPASKRRVKPSDPRGKIMGFTDNVFDQKRRQRIGNAGPSGNPPDQPSVLQISGQKRQISMSDLTSQGRPLRTLEFPVPELENTGLEYVPSAHFAFAHIIGWAGFLVMAQMLQDQHYLELQACLKITFRRRIQE